ncbi:uncharacterized protein L969DRAFT_94751 [Mixia osmundae IAM 14324]|uniref:Uncharacterized protein n=1 Tax=Mixia osmundae (strain CBS 9802 / IAM 14324 / JCM 22182 / KY 12970) TaxID=764103 RepID=G7E449_MIXOS|nr:uncharacterized protein L969DRAFT_94751 [Mixia osmundae IAM 14324]KEI39704.1 hypothetical protein L969DRAFT_94751 [Mixia osmundae IAM 14324]GAA97609.1 hypothetical protein E5Q_04287 [Mixia osmundae IAM 14324]
MRFRQVSILSTLLVALLALSCSASPLSANDNASADDSGMTTTGSSTGPRTTVNKPIVQRQTENAYIMTLQAKDPKVQARFIFALEYEDLYYYYGKATRCTTLDNVDCDSAPEGHGNGGVLDYSDFHFTIDYLFNVHVRFYHTPGGQILAWRIKFGSVYKQDIVNPQLWTSDAKPVNIPYEDHGI